MKSSMYFKGVIKEYLDKYSLDNIEFNVFYTLATKTIDQCILYILNKVKDSGECGFDDSEIYNMAIEYYTTENVVIKDDKIEANVVVNRKVVKPESDIATRTPPKPILPPLPTLFD